MLWTMLLTYPLMAGIQEISAWRRRVTGVGIADNIRAFGKQASGWKCVERLKPTKIELADFRS